MSGRIARRSRGLRAVLRASAEVCLGDGTPGKRLALRKRLSVVVLGAALAPLLGTFAHSAGAYGGGRCEQAVIDRLERLNVDMSDVRNVFYTLRIKTSRDDSRVVGIYAWVNFHSCKGSLVMHMTTRCRVTVAFTRGECHVPGLSD